MDAVLKPNIIVAWWHFSEDNFYKARKAVKRKGIAALEWSIIAMMQSHGAPRGM